MRDLGEAGELAFRQWCAISGITANKSDKDRYGWDLFIECDSGSDVTNALEMHEPLIECKIQIKATDQRRRSVPVSLSNLRSMATTPLPSFYVLLEFDTLNTPTRAFIKHIDEKLISEILQRIRKETTKKGNIKLHKKTMQIKFSSQTEVTPLTPENIKAAITQAIGASPSKYIKTKQSFLETVGFENGSHSVNFTLDGTGSLEEFVNMQIGIEGSAEIINISSFITRFGIPSETLELKSDSAVLKISNVVPDSEGSIEFRDRTSGLTIRYPVNVYRGGLAPWIPQKLQKVRLSSDFLDIRISTESRKMEVNYHFNHDTEHEISEHKKLYKLTELLSQPNNIDIIISVHDRKIQGKLKGEKVESEPDFLLATKLLNILEKIKSHFELHDPLKISLSEIYKNRNTLINFEKLLTPKESGLIFSVNIPKAPPLLSRVDCLYIMGLKFGGIAFIELIAIKGILTESQTKTHSIDLLETSSVYKTTFPAKDFNKTQLKKDLQNAANRYTSEAHVIDLTNDFFNSIKFN